MKYRTLGRTGLKVSEIGFGGWAIGGGWGPQAETNCTVSELPDMLKDLLAKLRGHAWRRAFWYGGK